MALKSDGTVYIDTRVDTKGFGKSINTMQKQVGGLTSAFGKLGLAITAAFAVKKLIQFGREATELGSDLQEVQNVVDVTFTTMSDKVDEFAKNAAKSAGLSETMAKRYSGTFGAMAKAFGFAENEAFTMSTALTQLAGDVASFYNITQDEAYTKLKSVFTGETESLKDLGVVMTQTALDSFAMAEGYGKTTREMTEQQKVALRYQFVLKQLSAASGDFERTSDSWANLTRVFKLSIESIKANIGQGLINLFTPILKVINSLIERLAVLASSFKAFTELISGNKSTGSVSSVASDLNELQNGYESSAESAEELANATNASDKANKKYLSGLDEIRTYTSQDKADTGIGGISVDYGNLSQGTDALEESTTAANAFLEKMKELANVFKEGFTDGLGDFQPRLDSIKESIASIKNSISNILKDAGVQESVQDFVDTFTYSLGQVSGSVTSIGLTIATNLLGGISGYLETESPRIKEYLIDMFEIGAGISEKAGEFSSAFSYIFESLSNEDGQKITEDIIAIFGNAFMSITELLGQFSLDVTTLLVNPFVNSKEEIKTSFEDLLSGLSEFTSSARKIFDEFFQLLSQLYTEHISPIFEKLIPEMEALYKEHIAPLLTNLGEFFSEVGDNLSALWNELFKPFIDWFIENIMPVISPIIEAVGKTFIDVFGTIFDIISGFVDILSGLISILVGTFTGDWKRVWDGIKSIFVGIWNTLVSVFETFINSSINLINGLIDGVNNITGKIGIPSIPNIATISIPKLATGAVIPPNAPFLAQLGDQKHGTNIEAPLDTIKQAVREVVGSNGNGTTYHFVAQLNGQTLFEQFVSQAQLVQMSTGQNPITAL